MDIKEHFSNLAKDWQNYRHARRYYWDAITRRIEYYIHPEQSVLEIGCATGELIGSLNCKRRVGIDFCAEMIEKARSAYSNTDFILMRAEEITLDEKFDVVILSNLTGYTPDIQAVLEQALKVCHPQTRVIINQYNHLWEPLIHLAEWLGIKRKAPQQNWITTDDMKGLLYLAGFDCYKTEKATLLPIYIPLLSLIFNKYIAQLPGMEYFCLDNFFYARPLPKAEEGWEKKYSVTVLVPARNESGNLRAAIERTPEMGSRTELLFVEGNSTDDTWEKLQELAEEYKEKRPIRIMQQKGKGKGDAVRCGYAEATGDVLMILDADLTVPPEDLPKFYKAIATGKGEFINGVRLVYPMEDGAMRTLNTIGNHFFSRLFTYILGQPIKDTLCGTKVMTKQNWQRLTAGREFFGDFDPFGDFDMLFGAHKLNLKIIDVPIRYKERKYGDTNISRFSHGWLLLRMSAFAARRIRFRH